MFKKTKKSDSATFKFIAQKSDIDCDLFVTGRNWYNEVFRISPYSQSQIVSYSVIYHPENEEVFDKSEIEKTYD